MTMQNAFLAIQCTAPCGTVGTFLYSEKDENGFRPVSPVMTDSVALYQWAAANGWRSCAGPSPVGNYEKEDAPDFAEFLAGYAEALLWSSTDTVAGEDVNLDQFELSTAGADSCRADCLEFFTANHADLATAADCLGYSWAHAGHDFALTRNGHGAGFWDGDLSRELGDRLTAASKAAGECCPYVGDDYHVHIS